jgi:histidyl-tRNA synthetase
LPVRSFSGLIFTSAPAAIKAFNLPQWAYTFDPTMVRGLDYYTGTIFETYVEEPKIGSITGGGRYDTLIKTLGGPDIPAVGTTLGLDRIVDCIIELNLLPNLPKTKTKIMVANFGEDTLKESLNLVSNLRDNNISTLLYPDADKIGKQFKYASEKFIPFVALIGSNEAIKNEIRTKDSNLKGTIASQGTTPRRYVDLIGSLCDLTSGSGDKGTPVVYISGYFDNYSVDN